MLVKSKIKKEINSLFSKKIILLKINLLNFINLCHIYEILHRIVILIHMEALGHALEPGTNVWGPFCSLIYFIIALYFQDFALLYASFCKQYLYVFI